MNILVVDDEPAMASYVAHILTTHGHNVLALNDSADALEHARAINFDLAFIGIVMPGMNGLELGMRVRKLLPHCAIILGVENVPGILGDARSMGYDCVHLPAPFEPEELLSTIRSVVK